MGNLLFTNTNLSQNKAQEALTLANQQQIRQAVKLAQQILSASQPSLFNRLLGSWSDHTILDQLKIALPQWEKKIEEAEKLAQNAKEIWLSDQGNPLDFKKLLKAIAMYEKCLTILPEEKFIQDATRCREELTQRQNFQQLVTHADWLAQQRFYQEALQTYTKAQSLFSTLELTSSINNCSNGIEQEKLYQSKLEAAKLTAAAGQWRKAIALLELALTEFTRADGIALLEEWQHIIKAKEKYRLGLTAEQQTNYKTAIIYYQEAHLYDPKKTSYQIRLGIVATKLEDWDLAIKILSSIDQPKAKYYLGFALMQQGEFHQAEQAWKDLHEPQIDQIKKTLQQCQNYKKQKTLTKINQLVDNQQFEQAKNLTLKYLESYPLDQTVSYNLDQHIIPQLEHQTWQKKNWKKLIEHYHQEFFQTPNINSLHNWAIALYNSYKSHQQIELENLIYVWSTTLLNLNQNPTILDIPWIGSHTINHLDLINDLTGILEQAIAPIQTQDISRFLQLRDRLRLELATLKLIKQHPDQGLKIKNIILTPGFYRFYRSSLTNLTLQITQTEIASLYTDWGLSVAACLEKDPARAIQIKPTQQPTALTHSLSFSTLAQGEQQAMILVSYHEGCYYLQQKNWWLAVKPLNKCTIEIKLKPQWITSIDQLCDLVRQSIKSPSEHLELAQFWYELTTSALARSYFIEHKTEQIKQQLAKQQITPEIAHGILQKLSRIDPENSLIHDLIDRIQLAKQTQEIYKLLQKSHYQEAVSKAKQLNQTKHSHQEIRFFVAQFCLEKLRQGLENRKLAPNLAYQLGRWAYELCPHQPEFQEIYISLKLK